MRLRYKVIMLFALLTSYANAELNITDEIEQGRRIYQEGILTSGKALQGIWYNSNVVSSKQAACTNCHKKSGLGGSEGKNLIPPINGSSLFHVDVPPIVVDVRTPRGIVQPHAPYDDVSLAVAIRTATKNDGKDLSPMMPKYNLNDADMKSLTAYLHQLSIKNSIGVDDTSITFATVITPDVTPEQRKILLDMTNSYYLNRNASWHAGGRRMRMGAELIPRTERDWKSVIWDLKGPENTWHTQLDEYYSNGPVFALTSGISNSTWAPIHNFCEIKKIPCLFPSVSTTYTKDDSYSFYFSKGTALEASILANYITTEKQTPNKIIQVFRDDVIGRNASQALSDALSDSNIKLKDYILSDDIKDLQKFAKTITSNDVVVFWLNATDITTVTKAIPPPKQSYFSGLLANDPKSDIFSKKWLTSMKLIYPFELPSKRSQQVNPLKTWLTTYNIPLVDEKLQSEILFNLFLLSTTTAQMIDNLYRDYMVEQIEMLLSQGTNRTTYPWLEIGPNQRFVSKSGYIVKFKGTELVTVSDRIVP